MNAGAKIKGGGTKPPARLVELHGVISDAWRLLKRHYKDTHTAEEWRQIFRDTEAIARRGEAAGAADFGRDIAAAVYAELINSEVKGGE